MGKSSCSTGPDRGHMALGSLSDRQEAAHMHVFIRPTQTFLACHVCSGLLFASREIKMTTTGMTLMDLDWLNRSAEGVICLRCGYVHTFMAQAHQWVEPATVDPSDLPVDPLA
jgi:predicted nucleic-acid-binding Zn-ribbon protein